MTVSNNHRHYALAILTVTYVFNFVDRQLLAILLEPIKTEFGASDSAMGLLYGLAFSLFYATLAIPVARFADKSNRRNILAVAAGLWSIMTVACGFAANFWQMLGLRIGVAVGEAGGVPPSQSMVNDLYPPEQRARAMAVFSSATFIGTLIAMVGGALIAQKYGWRMTFLVVGAPGIILAFIIRFTISEPKRGAFDATSDGQKLQEQQKQGLLDVFSEMWNSPALRYLILGCASAGLGGYALGYWAPAFMMRVHGLSLVQAGVMIGGLGAISGLTGSFFGAWLCDRFAKENRNWLLFIPAISLIISLPLLITFLMFPEQSTFSIGSQTVPTAILIYCIASFIGSWWAAPTYVAVQELVAPNKRTLACAILLFTMNLIGFGLGPLLVGVFSDLLTPAFGNDAVRYALVILMGSFIPAIYFYSRAGRLFSQQRFFANNQT
jgi:MFS family permease